MAAFRWFCDVTSSASYKVVREALDAAWSPDNARRAPGEWDVTALVPAGEEGELLLGSAVAQNAVACVAYALEVHQTGEVQKAVWAARQLYEAADAVVQQGAAIQTYVEDMDQEPPRPADGPGNLRRSGRCGARLVSGSAGQRPAGQRGLPRLPERACLAA